MNTQPKFQIGDKVYKIIIYPSWLNGGINIKEIEVEAIKVYKNGTYEYFYDSTESFRDEDVNESIFVDKKMATERLIEELEDKLKTEKQYVKNLINCIKKLKKSIHKY
jgi:glutaredoxin 2